MHVRFFKSNRWQPKEVTSQFHATLGNSERFAATPRNETIAEFTRKNFPTVFSTFFSDFLFSKIPHSFRCVGLPQIAQSHPELRGIVELLCQGGTLLRVACDYFKQSRTNPFLSFEKNNCFILFFHQSRLEITARTLPKSFHSIRRNSG